MKTTKTVKATKKVAKKFKPTYVVDLTWCTNDTDIREAFIRAKVKAGIAITEQELDFIESNAIDEYADFRAWVDMNLAKDVINFCIKAEASKKKTPWYKKLMFWKKNK